ncbi:hypothetical protein MAR621_03140 [Maribacter dokdonensis]|uniref:hypothetical protein n=1 Tax=Maribacter dokdonensis TaxID=320912 RepID=UPI001B01E109|nr:hypothetical protein [Maribacter dokdonensis]CAG2532946.1 hypothetical protein MAR621_03140 [Maribacter dokdonensis]
MKIIKLFAYVIAGFVVLFVGAAVFAGIFSSSQEDQEQSPINTNKIVQEENAEPKKIENWEYSSNVDEMDGNTNYFAVATSINQLDFDFPYNGGSNGYITIRNMDGENTIAISVDKGQFQTSFGNNEHLRIKFDDEELRKYNFSSASDGSMNVVFPAQAKALIQKIKASKTVKIEAPFYNEGRQVLNFNIDGLVWDN